MGSTLSVVDCPVTKTTSLWHDQLERNKEFLQHYPLETTPYAGLSEPQSCFGSLLTADFHLHLGLAHTNLNLLMEIVLLAWESTVQVAVLERRPWTRRLPCIAFLHATMCSLATTAQTERGLGRPSAADVLDHVARPALEGTHANSLFAVCGTIILEFLPAAAAYTCTIAADEWTRRSSRRS